MKASWLIFAILVLVLTIGCFATWGNITSNVILKTGETLPGELQAQEHVLRYDGYAYSETPALANVHAGMGNGNFIADSYSYNTEDASLVISGYVFDSDGNPLAGVPLDLEDEEEMRIRTEEDLDGDGIPDEEDNCPNDYNPLQQDSDGDGFGDECDNCPDINNPGQMDSDGDDLGDACDNCAYANNSDQSDIDNDHVGNMCDKCPDAYGGDFDGGCFAFILLGSDSYEGMQGTIDHIESEGKIYGEVNRSSHITLIHAPHVLIGYIPPEVVSQLLTYPTILEITYDSVSEEMIAPYGESALEAAKFWNAKLSGGIDKDIGREAVVPIVDSGPPNVSEGGEGIGTMAAKPAPFDDTSEYAIGSVAVQLIIPESNASSPDNENWTAERRTKVYNEIKSALNWWANKEAKANLRFTWLDPYLPETSYEPIKMNSSQEGIWISEIMDNLRQKQGWNFTFFNWYRSKVRSFDNFIREKNRTDWAFTVFVVDSKNDGDGEFDDDAFAYAYIQGPFIIMTYDNANYGIDQMDSVMAHEMGHIFGAIDEYSCCSCGDSQEQNWGDCTWSLCGGQAANYQIGGHVFWDEPGPLGVVKRGCRCACDCATNKAANCGSPCNNCSELSGFLQVPNGNCECCAGNPKTSIMRGSTSRGSPYANGQISSDARKQIGWRDTDGDRILDPVDTNPDIDLTSPSYHLVCINDNTPMFKGFANDSQNYITKVLYIVNHTDWNGPNGSATADDGAFDESYEKFTLTLNPLADGIWDVSIRPFNSVNQGALSYPGPILYIDTIAPTQVTNLHSSSHTISTWDNDNTIDMKWTDATDATYGNCMLSGYSIVWDNNAGTIPDTTVEAPPIGNSTLAGSPLADGTWYFHIRAADTAGNAGNTVHLGPFYIDTRLPDAPAYNTAQNQWFRNNPNLDIDFSDNLALDDVYHKVDSGTWNSIVINAAGTSYTANWLPADWNSLSEGWHYIYFNISDDTGNIYSTPNQAAAFRYGKDVSAPNTTDNAPSAWQKSDVNITLTATDTYSGVNTTYYCADQANSCNPTTIGNSVSVTAEGINYVRYYSKDNTGNNEAVRSAQVRIDKTTPTTTDNAPMPWQNASVTVNLTANDVLSGMANTYYCADQANSCNPTTIGNSVSVTAEGINYVRYYSVDNAGNNEAAKNATVKIDKTKPVVEAGPDQIVMKNDIVYFNGSTSYDTLSGIASYTWDFGDDTTGSNAITSHTYLTAGNYTITLTVKDNAGNSDIDRLRVVVKAKPVAIIDIISPNPATRGANITFKGHGTDDDGTITEYYWNSSIEGYLSNQSQFGREMLNGSHAINFLVKDNDNLWSDPAVIILGVYLPPDWPMFHKEIMRNGVISAAYPTPDERYGLLWKDNMSAAMSSPAVANIDNIWNNGLEMVIGSSDNNIYAFASNGTLLWSYATNGSVNSTPAIADLDNNTNNGLEIVVGSTDNNVYAINSSGNLLWSYMTNGAVISSPAIADIDNDNNLEIAIGSGDNNLYILDKDGNIICSYLANDKTDSSPAFADLDKKVAGLEIAFGCDDNNVYVIDSNCNMLGSYATFGDVDSSPAIADINGDGFLEIVTGSDDGNIYAITYNPNIAAKLALLWNFPTNAPVDSSPALATYEYNQWIIAVGSDNGNVYALWQNGVQFPGSPFGTGASVDSSPAIADLNTSLFGPEVIVGSDSQMLFAINFLTNPATMDWIYVTKNAIDPSPAIADINHDGKLEIATASSLYVLHKFTNIVPNPNPDGPYNVGVGYNLILDGSLSFDPDEEFGDFIAKYEWDINNDGFFYRTGEFVELTWPEIESEVCIVTGTCIIGHHYPVALKVTDSYGASDTAFTEIIITEVPDADGDGVPDSQDNCIQSFNPNQYDSNQDGYGIRCDTDADNDGNTTNNDIDGCTIHTYLEGPLWNPDCDFNEDGVIDMADLTILASYYGSPPGPSYGANQDGDGWIDERDNCPAIPNPSQEDSDTDGVGDACDNCPEAYNPGQEDSDSDGTGDVCELTGDVDDNCVVNIFDLAAVGLCYGCSEAQGCWDGCRRADVYGNGIINIFDLATVGLNYGKVCPKPETYTCCLENFDETCFSATIEGCRSKGGAVMECIPHEPTEEEPPGIGVNYTKINETSHAGWLANLTGDVNKTGVPNRTYVPGTHDCDDFADELERNLTAMGYRATYTVYWWNNGASAHAVADVHAPDGSLVFIEPQTGEIINLDFDNDGKVEARYNEHKKDHTNPTDDGRDIEVYDDAQAASDAGCPRD